MRAQSLPLPIHWQDKAIIGISLFLAVSPWILGYADHPGASWNAVVIAVIMAASAASLIYWRPFWPDFIGAFFGFWLVISFRILDFGDRLVPLTVAVVVGVSVVVLGLWSAVLRAHELLRARKSGVAAAAPKAASAPVMPPPAQTA